MNRAIKRFSSNIGYELSETNVLRTAIARDMTLDHKQGESGHWAQSKGKDLQDLRGVDIESEFDLFSFYGLRFIPPTERNVLTVVGDDGDALQMSNKSGDAGDRDDGGELADEELANEEAEAEAEADAEAIRGMAGAEDEGDSET